MMIAAEEFHGELVAFRCDAYGKQWPETPKGTKHEERSVLARSRLNVRQ